MSAFLLAYCAGVLTVLSPCILPVLPFVLAGGAKPFSRSGLPLLVGMALAFAAAASLAAVAGEWAAHAHTWGRYVALALLAFFALTLLVPTLADRMAQPLVRWGAHLAETRAGPLGLGLATGLLWAPCAGPVLGLILAGAAVNGANAGTTLLLFAYAGGAATSLGAVLLVGRRGWKLGRSARVSQWLRRGLGAAVLLGVSAIATGTDTRVLAQLSAGSTQSIENRLISAFNNAAPKAAGVQLDGAVAWLNSPALSREDLKGKVVLVHFWTYSCINCIRTLPYVRAWADKYKNAGLVVVGVHSPEFAFEKNLDHVKRAVSDLRIQYPVAVDSRFSIWRAFNNSSWPALYFIDGQGRVRDEVAGEGRYEASERLIQQLLAENGRSPDRAGLVAVQGEGAEAAPSGRVQSGETYIGYERASNFAPFRGIVSGKAHDYKPSSNLPLNHWTLAGSWNVQPEYAIGAGPETRLSYRFRARDLHLVLGRESGAAPVQFRIRIDGKPPQESRGADIDAQGFGRIDAHRLYHLVRQPQGAAERLFEIEFMSPGAQVYAFTFG